MENPCFTALLMRCRACIRPSGKGGIDEKSGNLPSVSSRLLSVFWRRALAVPGLLVLALGLPAMVSAQTCVPTTTADWMVSGDPLAQDIRPRDCQTVQQTPPDFRWPDVIPTGGYQVTLTYPDGHAKTLPATQNWINWDELLPAGTYSWSASYTGGTASKARRFIVDANSRPFLVPAPATLLSTILAKPHPRSLPDATTLATMKSQRTAAISSLLGTASAQIGKAVPSAGVTAADVQTYGKLALVAMQACVFSNLDTYCNDAIRRVTNLAAWDPNGPTSYVNNSTGMDQWARDMTVIIAFGYDWLYPRLTAAQRTQILNSLNIRNAVMYNDIIGTRSRIAKYPRDSHGNQTLTQVAVISVLLAGDLPIAKTWVQAALPQALNALNPWGGDEGGFANSATYGNTDMGAVLPSWYALRYATGIDVGQKAWVRNWGRYFAYFTPPGIPGGTTVFGDGFEQSESEHQARYGKGYTFFAPTPLGRWHMSRLTAEDPTRFEYLMAPPADFSGTQPFPPGTPNSTYFQSIGQVAMHSDLSNLARTSVYFKSSPPPDGAFNHSHADQNSFVINAAGQRLAIESGYYDGYKTPHWWNWYHATKAKNAITYDGGQGQLFFELNSKMGYGQVTSFTPTPAYDIVTGDATPSYGGALTMAQRSLLYFRPNLILVYDNLASPAGVQWEWNIHALNQMTSSSDTTATIQNGGQTLCITMLAGPAMHFTQTNLFSSNPVGSYAAQWHGKFYSATKIPSAEFVALLNVGCTAVTASATKAANGVWTVAMGATTATIANGTISLGAPPPPVVPPVVPPPVPPPTLPPPLSKPYTGTPILIPATFEAENFDLGGEGLAYHDTTKGNLGAVYRTAEDVDLIASCDPAGGGYVVNNFAAGEWLAYTINVPTAKNYDIAVNVSNNYATGAFHVEIDGVNVTGTLSGLATGNWCTFKWVGKTLVPLKAGVHVLKLVADQAYFNVNSIRVLASP